MGSAQASFFRSICLYLEDEAREGKAAQFQVETFCYFSASVPEFWWKGKPEPRLFALFAAAFLGMQRSRSEVRESHEEFSLGMDPGRHTCKGASEAGQGGGGSQAASADPVQSFRAGMAPSHAEGRGDRPLPSHVGLSLASAVPGDGA